MARSVVATVPVAGHVGPFIPVARIFIDSAPGQLAELEGLAASFKPDFVLCDPGMIGAVGRARSLPASTATPQSLQAHVGAAESSADSAPQI